MVEPSVVEHPVVEQVVARMTRPRRQPLDGEGRRLLLEGMRDAVWHAGRLLVVYTFGDARPDAGTGAPSPMDCAPGPACTWRGLPR